jgi:hypothetical protein
LEWLCRAVGDDRPSTCLSKSSGQIFPAVHRLVEEDYLNCDPPPSYGTLGSMTIVYPTPRAMLTVPAFDAMSDSALAAELASLKGGSV